MHEEAVDDDDDDAADKAKVFLPGLATRCKQDDRGAVSGSEGQWGAVRGRASVAWEIGKCMETTNMKLQA